MAKEKAKDTIPLQARLMMAELFGGEIFSESASALADALASPKKRKYALDRVGREYLYYLVCGCAQASNITLPAEPKGLDYFEERRKEMKPLEYERFNGWIRVGKQMTEAVNAISVFKHSMQHFGWCLCGFSFARRMGKSGIPLPEYATSGKGYFMDLDFMTDDDFLLLVYRNFDGAIRRYTAHYWAIDAMSEVYGDKNLKLTDGIYSLDFVDSVADAGNKAAADALPADKLPRLVSSKDYTPTEERRKETIGFLKDWKLESGGIFSYRDVIVHLYGQNCEDEIRN